MTAEIINLAHVQQAKTLAGLPTAAEGPPRPRWAHSPSLFALPFVTLAPPEVKDWGEFWKQTTLWNDEPTGDGDYRRGRQYARDAVAAIIRDGVCSRNLEQVVDAIVERGFRRRGPGGGLRRQLSAAEAAFLDELCRIAVEAVRQNGMPADRPEKVEGAS